ncbi:3-ketoacyl-ACP reductase [Flavobacterium akiainvivens]|uniref:3-ketoacyl-ACP reductase n=1 Tax=Flavobacterium akiainvivens TaxID=1202724 RepID=A0A0M9VHN4_9FLAO|nr:SDR family oxidoreductase [Flavobacterium akiainvivens]KOS05742.1 3-ketoacyl-ACP reductase [Flavobacterium akiainvivens]SFQ37689.1 3-oxoacyl-[acyl-carrier protein] reductase [Flavobacterium akiainvivens]
MKKLNGKVALVTGSSKGIGAVTAIVLAENGAKVIVNYNGSKNAAEEVVEKIKAFGGEAIALKADVSKETEVENLFNEAIAAFGKLDILINNAGIMMTKPIAQTSTEDFDKMFNINVKGVFNTLRQAATKLHDNGSIVNLTSTVTRTLFPGYGTYCATKGAVEQFTRIFAKEMGIRGINVNAVAPGPTETELFLDGKSEQDVARLAASNAFGRLGQPEDIANFIVNMASDDSKWVSGQIIGANGAMA